jgi:DNA-binding beta-propeller fold protein YncE
MRFPYLALLLAACGANAPAQAAPASAPAPKYDVRAIPIPGATPGVFLDYIAWDRAHGKVWVPAGGTGVVAVIDAKTDAVQTVERFPTKEVERRGQKRVVGPSAATVGVGYVYVGDRASAIVCAVDASELKKGECATLPSQPDGLAFVAGRSEIWVTTPVEQSITILDVGAPKAPRVIETMKLAGAPEGFAVDDARHLFFTNLEDKDKTLVIDSATRGVVKSMAPNCGEAGPRGLAVDSERKLLMVACTDHVVVLDEAGKEVGRLAAGDGIDNLEYVPAAHRLYVAAARAGTMTIADLAASGALEQRAVVTTAEGARNPVAVDGGKVYLTDSAHGGVLVVTPK